MRHGDPGYNEYMRDYMAKRYAARRAEALEILGGKCAVCGSTEDLQIDHIDPETKTIEISKAWNVSRARFLAELELCQALCAPHHRDKTADEKSVPHGGGKTGKRNCRCAKCKPLKNASVRRAQAKKRVASLTAKTPDF